MGTSIGSLVVKVLLGGILVAGLVVAIVTMKNDADDRRDARPKAEAVVDAKSGVNWEMYGTPEITETTSDLIIDAATGVEIPVRTYTVDHGTWIERVRVFDVAPGEIDHTQAARSTFGAPVDGDLGDLEFLPMDGFDAATGSVDGTITKDGTDYEVEAQVFATQINSFMVTGGVARQVGTDEVDPAVEAAALLDTLGPA